MLAPAIDRYVEEWFAQNPGVNLGVVELPLVGSVDLLPNRLEKYMYKRIHAVLLTNLLRTEVTVLGVPMQLRPVETRADT